jgi:hypothetical protein
MEHLFGLDPSVLSVNGLPVIDDEKDSLNFGLTVDWRCLFSEICKEHNAAALEHFLSCKDVIYHAPKRNENQHLSHQDLFLKAEKAWARIPNKLRGVLQRAITSDVNSDNGPVAFIQALEYVIFYFIDTVRSD